MPKWMGHIPEDALTWHRGYMGPGQAPDPAPTASGPSTPTEPQAAPAAAPAFESWMERHLRSEMNRAARPVELEQPPEHRPADYRIAERKPSPAGLDARQMQERWASETNDAARAFRRQQGD